MSRTRIWCCACASVLAWSWSGTAQADPRAWYTQGYSDCADQYLSQTSFTCSICGVSAGCDGGDCHWGGIKMNASDSASLNQGLEQGYDLYCVNQGGAILPTASPLAVQNTSVDQAFREASRPASKAGENQPLSAGSILNYTSRDVYGVALPFSTSFAADTTSYFDLGGSALVGRGKRLTQFGASLLPGYRYSSQADDSGSASFFGVAAPLQLVGNSGEGLKFGVGYQAGVQAIAGTSSSVGAGKLGFGAAADVLYTGGLVVPVQGILRYSSPVSPGTLLVLQPGIGVNLGAGGDVADTLQFGALGGLEMAGWIFGAQVHVAGGDLGIGIGATSVDLLGQSVESGSIQPPQRSGSQPPAPEPQRPAQVPTAPAVVPVAPPRASASPAATASPTAVPPAPPPTVAPAASSAPPAEQAPPPVDDPTRDLVILRDGTRVTGTIVKMEAGVFVTIDVDGGGRQTINWSQIRRVSARSK